jgi:L-lactate dehydrogenase complex protein LldG
MPDERDQILSRVREALASIKERAALPDYEGELAVMRRLLADRDPVAVFAERLKLLNGETIFGAEALAERLRAGTWAHGYCDPQLWPALQSALQAGFVVESEFDRERVDDYQFGITRAVGAIAETGTIILDDHTTSRRLAALAPWVHIAVVPRNRVFSDLTHAVTAFGDDPNVIWCTGPSRTADVEGILIRGVHGPGVQIALFLD